MKPRLLITMGDVAGIGPEIIVKAWPRLGEFCEPCVVGDPLHLDRAAKLLGTACNGPCVNPSNAVLKDVAPSSIRAAAGQAAYDWLCFAIDECLAGSADGIVTCPLHKEGLRAADIPFPGHTEILAERTKSKSHAMLLYDDDLQLAVAHVTLHMALRNIFPFITSESIAKAIYLLSDMVPKLTGSAARLGVLALNPHAGDGGLFGDEESRTIATAIIRTCESGINVIGPLSADAAFLPHNREKFNGLIAMYHDQGHIAMKLLGGRRAVNVTAGLPIVRTSVAHGTAYDIAGKGIADESSLIAAAKVAARLANARPNR